MQETARLDTLSVPLVRCLPPLVQGSVSHMSTKAAYLLSHQKVSLSGENGMMPHGLPLSETTKNSSFLSTHIAFGPLYLVQI